MFEVNRRPFTKLECSRLKELGLLPEQIEELERQLFWVENSGRKGAGKADVRDELSTLLTSTKELTNRLDLAIRATPQSNLPRFEAMNRIGLAHNQYRQYQPDEIDAYGLTENLLSALAPLTGAIEAALRDLSDQQTYHRTASFHPIAVLNEALQRGFNRHHQSKFLQDHQRKPDDNELPSAYNFTPSEDPSSAYMEIMGICYQAAGHPNPNPQLAIRKFIRWKREQTNHGRERANQGQTGDAILPMEQPNKGGRKPQRKAPKRSGLPL